MLGWRTSQASVSPPPPQVSHCPINLVSVSGLISYDPPTVDSILVRYTSSTSFSVVNGQGLWFRVCNCKPSPEGINPIASTVLWLEKRSTKKLSRRSSNSLQRLGHKVSSGSVLTSLR